ncbi:MAG: phospholipase D-like domain-containing protein, partial [Wenzhouxiangella sp.]
PNRPVAAELVADGVEVRWCNTQGEQCHDKLMLARFSDGHAELIAGSANFTRRNLDDLNLETSVRVIGSAQQPVFADARDYFERRWNNRDDREFSLDYRAHADERRLRSWRYRLMEATGLSTF